MKESLNPKIGLYIHVPFCPKVCHYCDFAVMKAPERLQWEWLEAIVQEYECRVQSEWKVDTLYLGGGTPSILIEGVFQELIQYLKSKGVLNELQEFTLELNPETASEKMLGLYRTSGVDRISMGVQTFDAKILNLLGRSHQPDDACFALTLLKDFDFELSLDFMFGLPEQSTEGFLGDLEMALQYHVNHISFYGLTVEKNTLFEQWERKEKLNFSDEYYDDMYLKGAELLLQHGLARYEVSNFARPGFESKHNNAYWKHIPYIGLGPGAHSFINSERSYGPRKFKDWAGWVGRQCESSNMSVERIEGETLFNEIVWLSLRRREGLNLDLLKEFGWYDRVYDNLEKSSYKKYLHMDSENIKLGTRGWLFVDEISADLIV